MYMYVIYVGIRYVHKTQSISYLGTNNIVTRRMDINSGRVDDTTDISINKGRLRTQMARNKLVNPPCECTRRCITRTHTSSYRYMYTILYCMNACYEFVFCNFRTLENYPPKPKLCHQQTDHLSLFRSPCLTATRGEFSTCIHVHAFYGGCNS